MSACTKTRNKETKRRNEITETTDIILEAMDEQNVTAAVLLDTSKAFDSLNHDILSLKLQDIGLSYAALTVAEHSFQERMPNSP